jgi:uncharacterized membrane protein
MDWNKMTETRGILTGGWRWALLGSLVLNLFLAALIGGFLLRTRLHGHIPEMSLARALSNAEATLSPPDAAKFDKVMRQQAPQFADSALQLAKARNELERQITADPFDSRSAKLAYHDWTEKLDKFDHAIGDTLVDALAQVSPEGRRKLIAFRFQAERTTPDRKPDP